MTAEQKAFNRGFACACALTLRNYDEPTIVRETYQCNFMTVKELQASGVDEMDIEILKPIIKELCDKQNTITSLMQNNGK